MAARSASTAPGGSLGTPLLTLAGGTLSTSGAARLGATTAVDVASGAQMQLSGNETLLSLSGSGLVTLGAGAVLTLGATGVAGDATFSGALTGSSAGGIVKQGTGRWTLSASNSYGGTTAIDEGTLALNSGSALPNGTAVTVSGTGTLDVITSETIGSLAATSSAASVTLGAGAMLTVSNASGGNTAFAGVISGGGAGSGLTKEGTGQFTLSGIKHLQRRHVRDQRHAGGHRRQGVA